MLGQAPGQLIETGPPSKLHVDIITTYNRTNSFHFLRATGAVATGQLPRLPLPLGCTGCRILEGKSIWMSLLFFKFSLLFILNRTLSDNGTCNTE